MEIKTNVIKEKRAIILKKALLFVEKHTLDTFYLTIIILKPFLKLNPCDMSTYTYYIHVEKQIERLLLLQTTWEVKRKATYKPTQSRQQTAK